MELPQLLNVIRGEMSLVGPRPERPEIVSDLRKQVRNYEARLAVKPGITGLAQIRHRYDETIEDVRKKVKYDIFYINEICLLVDLRIIFNTARYVFTGTSVR